MKEIFTYLCDFSIVTSIAILLAVLLRPVLKKGPSFIRCILWALVFLRLLVPVGLVKVPLIAPDLFASAEETVQAPNGEANPTEDIVPDNNAVQYPEQAPAEQPPAVQDPNVQTPDVQAPVVQDPDVQPPAVQDPNAQAPDVRPPAVQTPNVQVPDAQAPAGASKPGDSGVATAPVTDQTVPQPETGVDILFALSIVWAVGVAAMLGYMLASNLLLRYRVRNAIVFDSRIRVIDRECSPFVFGIFRPIIYIPASVSKADWPHIIAHETSHIKRFDHVLKPFAFFVLCFYWFDPLVWVAYILLGKDIEYACDERTVKSMENNDRKAYSLALLAVSQGENIVFAPPLSFGKVSVKERIKRVMDRKIPLWAMCLTIVLCASLLVLAALTPAAVDRNDTSSSEEGGSGDGEPFVELELSVAYADPAELDDGALFYDEQGYELVKITVNREVKAFKFIKVLYDDNTDPYAGDVLFETAALTPDTPFYAQTDINEGLSDRGISFLNDDGQTVAYRIMYDAYSGESTGDALYVERIAGGSSDLIRSASISYKPNASLPAYTVTVEYTDAGKLTASRLVLTEKESGKEVQRISLPENERFTDEPAYVMDLTFDGYADLILPNQKPAGAVWYHAFVWDAEAGQLVYAPGFSELSNVILDAGREQLLSYRVASQIASYSISAYDAEKQDFVTLHSLYWDWGNGWETVFKEYDEKDRVVNEFTFFGSTLYPNNPYTKQYFEEGSVWELNSAKWGAGAWTAGSGSVRYDENGNVLLSDPPTYDEVLALHIQDPEHYRDPGELQPETHEMIRLENGQWYQSYVWASFNCRCIFIHGEERGRSDWDYWTFIDIGSAENAFLFNVGVMYDDPMGGTMYSERPIAVRGTLSGGTDGYAYVLQLPDELIVCVEYDDGHAGLLNTETLAIPAAYASLFEGKTGEVVVTGVVMQDRNGVFYLKDVALYRPAGSQEPSEPTEPLTLPDFSSMALTEFFPEGNKYFDLGANAFRVIDRYVRGDLDGIKTKYALDETVVLPAQAPRNTIADYRDYCITRLSAEPYVLDGKQVEKVTFAASLRCAKKGQEGYLEFRLEFVNAPGAFDWKLLRLDVQNGSKPTGDDAIPLTDPMTVQDFLASSKCQELQATAFNFINAYFGGDLAELRRLLVDASWLPEDPNAWGNRSRDDHTGYGISWVKFEPYELDGKQVQGAQYFLSMFRAVPGEEGVHDPMMTFVYVEGGWKLLELDFAA